MNWSIPSFTFYPVRLAKITKQILTAIPEEPMDEQPYRRAVEIGLEEVLAKLKAISIKDLKSEAKAFSTRELDALAFGFPRVPGTLKQRASVLLCIRWKTRFGRSAWRHVQQYYSDPYLLRLIRKGLQTRAIKFASDAATESINKAFSTSDPVAVLSQEIIRWSLPFDETVKQLRVVMKSRLYYELMRRYLLSRKVEIFTERESENFILNGLKYLRGDDMPGYKSIIDFYLEKLGLDQLQSAIMKDILAALGHPRERSNNWTGIKEANRQKFIAWLNWQKIADFFQSRGDRFAFWKNFREHLVDARIVSTKLTRVAFLVFQPIVVIEFEQTGNAAYIYTRDHYESTLRPYALGRRSLHDPGVLKDRFHPSFKDRIIHSGYWQGRASQLIMDLLI